MSELVALLVIMVPVAFFATKLIRYNGISKKSK